MGISVDVERSLQGFSLHIEFSEAGKRIGILGASGSGKSMTLKMIAGIVNPDKGKIVFDGTTFYDSEQKINVKPQKREVGYLFQNYALFPNMTVLENVGAGIQGDKKKKLELSERVLKKFQLVALKDRYPSELSGGQQQRVALARIMAYSPKVILLDEPFSALDAYLKDKMQEELMEMLSDYQGTVIMVSHSRDEIYRFSDRLLIVDDGRVISHGSTKGIFAEPDTMIAARLTGCKNISRADIINAHTLHAVDWGIDITLKNKIPNNTHYVGFRAHQFEPMWGKREENCIKCKLYSKAELQFERNYYLLPETLEENHDKLLCWFVQRACWDKIDTKGMPDYLKLHERDLLLLQ
jgi:molybdate transport system ATP-binding protein